MQHISKKGWKIIAWSCTIIGFCLLMLVGLMEYNKELQELVNKWFETQSLLVIGLVMAFGGFSLINGVRNMPNDGKK